MTNLKGVATKVSASRRGYKKPVPINQLSEKEIN